MVDRIICERKMREIFDLYNNNSNSINIGSNNKLDIDINEMINVLEKAKEIFPSSDSRLEELANIIENIKEEISNDNNSKEKIKIK